MLLPIAVLSIASGVLPHQEDEEPDLVASNPDGSLKVAIRETVIGFDDPSMASDDIVLSPDNRGVAYLVMNGDQLNVVHNGDMGPTFEGIITESIQFSPGGAHLVYLASKDEKQFVVMDGVPHEHESIGAQGFAFGRNGRVGWVAGAEERGMYAVVDGEHGPWFDSIGERGVVFSPDGSRYAFVAREGGGERLVVDGEVGPRHDAILFFKWQNGSHLGHVTEKDGKKHVFYDGELLAEVDGVGKDGFVFPERGFRYAIGVRNGDVWSLIVDGELRGKYKNLLPGMTFSDGGERLAYLAGRGEGMFLVMDGRERTNYRFYESMTFGPFAKRTGLVVGMNEYRFAVVDGKVGARFAAIEQPGVRFSQDGQRTMYVGRRGDARIVVIDDELGEPFARFGSYEPAFIENRAVYSIRRKGTESLVVDGVEGKPYRKIEGLTFSPGGEHYAYIATKGGESILVRDGKERARYPHHVGQPVFSPNGKRLAWVAGRDRKLFVVVGGKEQRPFDFIKHEVLTFTPDNRHVAYAAADGAERYLVVDDVVVGNEWDGFLYSGDFVFDEEGRLEARTGRRGVWFLVQAEILE
jgi:hypothetical protein